MYTCPAPPVLATRIRLGASMRGCQRRCGRSIERLEGGAEEDGAGGVELLEH